MRKIVRAALWLRGSTTRQELDNMVTGISSSRRVAAADCDVAHDLRVFYLSATLRRVELLVPVATRPHKVPDWAQSASGGRS